MKKIIFFDIDGTIISEALLKQFHLHRKTAVTPM